MNYFRKLGIWLCWWRRFWYSLTTGLNVDGHFYKDDEVHKNCEVTISYCEICGKMNISWAKNNGLSVGSLDETD